MDYLNSLGGVVAMGIAFSILAFVFLLYFKNVLFTGIFLLAISFTYFMNKRRTSSEKYMVLNKQKEELELNYPSIVVQLNTI